MNQKQGAPNLEIMSVRLPDVRVGDMVSLNDPRGHRRWVRVIGLFSGVARSSRLWIADGETAHVLHVTAPHHRRVRIGRHINA